MDGAILAIIVLGSALVVVAIWVFFFKPAAKSDEPYGPFISGEGLEELYLQEYGEEPDFESEYLRKQRD